MKLINCVPKMVIVMIVLEMVITKVFLFILFYYFEDDYNRAIEMI